VIKQETLRKICIKLGLAEQIICKAIKDAVEKSINEILTPVVERSVTIALITTRELILKDFAYDKDPEKIIVAANNIVQNLAGSLALVTCREPLRMQLTNHIKKELKLVQQQNPTAKEGAEAFSQTSEGKSSVSQLSGTTQQNQMQQEVALSDLVQACSKENLELGCSLIKDAVVKKSLIIILQDKAIQDALEKRKRANQMNIVNFRDDAAYTLRDELPAQLQPNLNGLTDAQYRVYNDFNKLGRNNGFAHFHSGSELPEDREPQDGHNESPQSRQATYDSSFEGIVARILNEKGLNAVSRALLTNNLFKLTKGCN
jgi:CCR4-NOT transcription complex subunit 1